MSKSKRMEEIIKDVLKDEQWHNIGEIKVEINNRCPDLSDDSNVLSLCLFKLKKSNEIEQKKRGEYRLTNLLVDKEVQLKKDIELSKGKNEKKYSDDNKINTQQNEKRKERYIQGWLKYYKANFPVADFGMSDDEFHDGQWFEAANEKVIEYIRNLL